jgi:hypothetical protein
LNVTEVFLKVVTGYLNLSDGNGSYYGGSLLRLFVGRRKGDAQDTNTGTVYILGVELTFE